MGCDIHLYVEKKIDGKWVTADTWTQNEYEPERMCIDYGARFYSGRNYDLFSILADVRNGYGFAGVPTGMGFKPIDKPRGLPDDVCAEVADDSEMWGVDGHSHSYFTVAELMAYDWTQETAKTGVVSVEEYFDWQGYLRREGDGPRSYSGGISGDGIETVSEKEFVKRVSDVLSTTLEDGVVKGGLNIRELRKIAVERWPRLYIQVVWGTSYYKQAREFLSMTMPRLWKLAGECGGYDNVRIVFWFDN